MSPDSFGVPLSFFVFAAPFLLAVLAMFWLVLEARFGIPLPKFFHTIIPNLAILLLVGGVVFLSALALHHILAGAKLSLLTSETALGFTLAISLACLALLPLLKPSELREWSHLFLGLCGLGALCALATSTLLILKSSTWTIVCPQRNFRQHVYAGACFVVSNPYILALIFLCIALIFVAVLWSTFQSHGR